MAAIENNQSRAPKSNGRGGARVGAGRKAGAATKKTRAIADAAMESGVSPLEYMLQVMRDPGAEPRERMKAAADAAPYMHPKLQAVTLTGENGGPIAHSLEISFK